MKANIFKMMVAAMVCATAMIMASCCNDDSEIIANSNAGEFRVKNLRTGNLLFLGYPIVARPGETVTISMGSTNATGIQVGDTLVISFVPDKEFSNLEFKFSHLCDGKEIGDSIFTQNLSIDQHSLTLNATYKDSNYDLSENKETTFDIERGTD